MTRHITHPVQIAILHELLFTQGKRFAELQAGKDLTSAHLTFHIRKLLEARLVQKRPTGTYELTAKGKEYANRLMKGEQTFSEQPKLSVLLHVQRSKNGQPEFLIQRRLKQPHYGFYGRISGKVRLGEPLTKTAQRILYEETGLTAQFSFRALLRKYDYQERTTELLEDKMFAVMQAWEPQGKLIEDWSGGRNIWMTADAFLQLDPSVCFTSARDFMVSPDGDSTILYSEESSDYKDGQY